VRIAGDVEAEESDAIICNGKKYLSDICYVIISTRGNVVLYLVCTMFVRRTEGQTIKLEHSSFNACDNFTFIFPCKPQNLLLVSSVHKLLSTFARRVSFDMSKKQRVSVILNRSIPPIQPEHLQIHLECSLPAITPLVSFLPVYHL